MKLPLAFREIQYNIVCKVSQPFVSCVIYTS